MAPISPSSPSPRLLGARTTQLPRPARVASMASAATFPKLWFRPSSHIYSQTIDPVHGQIKFCNGCHCQMPTTSLLVSGGRRSLRNTFLPVSAGATPSLLFTEIQKLLLLLKPPRNAGRGSSIAAHDSKKDLSLESVKTSVVSRDDEKINVRVQLPGKATQKVFDEALVILARDAPPVPGFRKSKGGKTSNIPSSILLQMLGKSRVTKFVLQEILSITIGEFVKKENLKVNPEIQTTQSEAEMESAFTPGSAFGFNVVLQLEKYDGTTEEDSVEQPDTSE